MREFVVPDAHPWNKFQMMETDRGPLLCCHKNDYFFLSTPERYILRCVAKFHFSEEGSRFFLIEESHLRQLSALVINCQDNPAETCFDAWLFFDNSPHPPPYAKGPLSFAGLRKPLDFGFLVEMTEQPAPLDPHGCQPGESLSPRRFLKREGGRHG